MQRPNRDWNRRMWRNGKEGRSAELTNSSGSEGQGFESRKCKKSFKESPKESSRKEKLFSSPEFIFVGAKSRSFVRLPPKNWGKKGAAINLVVRGDGTQPKKINKNKKDATARDKSWAGHETRTVEGQPIDAHKELGTQSSLNLSIKDQLI